MLCFQVAGSMRCWEVSLIQVLGSVMLAASHCQGKLSAGSEHSMLAVISLLCLLSLQVPL